MDQPEQVIGMINIGQLSQLKPLAMRLHSPAKFDRRVRLAIGNGQPILLRQYAVGAHQPEAAIFGRAEHQPWRFAI